MLDMAMVWIFLIAGFIFVVVPVALVVMGFVKSSPDVESGSFLPPRSDCDTDDSAMSESYESRWMFRRIM